MGDDKDTEQPPERPIRVKGETKAIVGSGGLEHAERSKREEKSDRPSSAD